MKEVVLGKSKFSFEKDEVIILEKPGRLPYLLSLLGLPHVLTHLAVPSAGLAQFWLNI